MLLASPAPKALSSGGGTLIYLSIVYPNIEHNEKSKKIIYCYGL